MSIYQQGHVPWNKNKKCPNISKGLTGKTLSPLHIQHLRDSHMGKKFPYMFKKKTRTDKLKEKWKKMKGVHFENSGQFKKGNIPFYKGKKCFKLQGVNSPSKRPEVRKKISNTLMGHIISTETRNKISKTVTQYQYEHGCLMEPNVGRYEEQILDYIEKMLDIKIQRQYKIKNLFLDGYCKEKNIVFEVDELHHFDENGKLREEDIKRQQKIQNELNCNFIRIHENFRRLL